MAQAQAVYTQANPCESDEQQVGELLIKHHLPAIAVPRSEVQYGGVLPMSYANDPVEAFRQGATYVDRILRGAFRALTLGTGHGAPNASLKRA
jgi:hypothetical protein